MSTDHCGTMAACPLHLVVSRQGLTSEFALMIVIGILHILLASIFVSIVRIILVWRPTAQYVVTH
jgi:hypothetical protein